MKPRFDIAQDARDLLAMERKPTKSDVTHTSAPAPHAKRCRACGFFFKGTDDYCPNCGPDFK